ncbi:MAG TPA: LPS assembly lipoprotein LptE [Casimicrobiaceae bacterium]|nr:LPS assembly lipoprotein LptE [Casimicrobiaceae bacterium]
MLVLASLPLLVSCGFQLRGSATYPFETIYVNSTGSPPLGTELRRILTSSTSAKPVDVASKAQVILDVPIVADDKEVLSLSSAGAVQEYQLTKRITFRLHDTDGNDWLPPAEIVVRRAYTFNQSQVLARDAEEQRLLQEMQTDIVYQLVRRLQAAKKPA